MNQGWGISDTHHVPVNRPPFLNWLVPNDLLNFCYWPTFYLMTSFPFPRQIPNDPHFLTKKGNKITYFNPIKYRIFQAPALENPRTPHASTISAHFTHRLSALSPSITFISLRIGLLNKVYKLLDSNSQGKVTLFLLFVDLCFCHLPHIHSI